MLLNTIIILQARTGSSRLPSKVLMPIQGVPLLIHCIRRLKTINFKVPVIVATSSLLKDDEIEKLSKNEKVECFRGSEEDVLDRYLKASRKYNAKYIIRATSDNPFVDISEAMKILEAIISGKWDYVNMFNKVDGRKLPIGVGVEAFSIGALQESWEKGHAPHHREHVNEYILENQGEFRIKFLPCFAEHSCPDLRLTVDTPKDFEFILSMIDDIGCPSLQISTKELVQWWKYKS